MHKIDRLQGNLKKLKGANLENVVHGVIKDWVEANEKVITDYVVRQQYDQSITAEGKPINPINKPYTGYSEPYKRKKQSMGLYRGKIDLRLTGEYHESFYIIVGSDFFQIKSNRVENGFDVGEGLKALYGDAVFGWTDDNKQKIIDAIKPFLVKAIKNVLLS